MTSPSERKVIFNLYLELKRRRKQAEEGMQANHQRPFYGGIMDDDEYRRLENERNAAYDYWRGVKEMCDAIWASFKSQYTPWDTELAIQENEGRIGDLPFVQ